MAKRPIRVSILATPNTSPSTLYGLFDMLTWLSTGWEAFVTGLPAEPRLDVRIVAAGREPIRCAGGVVISPHLCVEEAEDNDIVLVASLGVPDTSRPENHDGWAFDWLVRQHSRGTTIASACTGAILLAEAGLLNGWEATSHWAFRDMLRVHYPETRWRLEKDLCVSGHEGQIVTAGGSTNWQELALYIAARFCSAEHAGQLAKFWMISSREETQASFSAMCHGIPHEDGAVSECQEWIAENFAKPNPVAEMVRRSGLPPTTFARRFKRATGYSPIEYVQTMRIEKAKQMLEVGGDAVEVIGRSVGYGDPVSFRRLFKRKAGLTPGIYRRRFARSRFERLGLMQ
jgi:transcriptional regulator GlxA family with amidase domain